MIGSMRYRGYSGSVEFSEEDGVLHGQVLGIRSLLSFEGTTVEEIKGDFHACVDEYLEGCAQAGRAPELPFKGTFNVRVPQPLHERVALYAKKAGKSLNACVCEALERYAETVIAPSAG